MKANLTGWRRATRIGAVALVAALTAGAAAACSSSPSTTSAPSHQKVTLTFWTWVPDISKVVAIWNKAHPDIQVQVQTQAAGDPELTKLLTAAKAGDPPDIAQVEYQALPTLVSSNYLANIASETSSLSADYPSGIWNQVTLGSSAVYGVPQDAAPMALFYQPAAFTRYKLTVPTTWAEFLADAKKLHSEAPSVYLSTFSSEDPGEFAGLAQQAGGQWWSASGSTWKVGIDDAATQKVFSYWQQLVASGGVNNQPQWTAAWDKGMNDGQYIAWVSDVWAPSDLTSDSASDAGKWQMTALPQWSAGQDITGNWGGSSTAVMAASKHQQDAAEFATWLNTNPTATADLASVCGIYPADTAAEAALTTSPSYFSNQSNFWSLAKQLSSTSSDVTWGPDVDLAYSDWTTDFGTAATNKSSFLTPLAQLQTAVLNDMKKSGFTAQAG